MALSYVAASTPSYSTGSPVANLPAGLQTGDLVVAVIMSKPAVSGDAWADWNSLGGLDSTTGVAQGIDVGPTRISMRSKIWNTATDTAPTLTIASNITALTLVAFRSTTGNYALDLATGEDTSAGTGYSAPMSGHHSATANDHLLSAIALPSDAPTPSTARATAITGLTLSAATVVVEPETTLGQDLGGIIFRNTVTSGTATAAGTITATLASATGAYGPAARLRIREANAVVTATRATTWNVAGQAGITPGNSSTNAVGNTRSITLSPPSGVQQGDLLVAVLDHYISNDGTDNLNWDSIPAGWTTVAQQYSSTGQSNHLSMYYKTYSTSDTTYTWAHGANVASTTIAGGIQAYSNATATAISASSWPNTSALNFTTTPITLTANTQWVVGAGGTYWGTSITWAARNDSTERIDRDATTDDAGVWLGDRAPGSTGSFGVEGTTGGAEGASAERCYISLAIDIAVSTTSVTASRATTWNVASSTTPVTASRATTWNVSAPPAALALDASTPAMVGKTTTGTTLTTSSFTAPANSLIVAAVSTDWNDSQAAAVTLTDTGGLTWTLRARRSRLGTQTPTGGTLGGGGVYIWTAVPTSATSRTVTATQGGGTGYAMAMDVSVYTYDGTTAPTWGDLDTAGGTGLPSASNTTTAATSWSWAVTDNFAAGGAATLGAGQTKVNEHHVATLFTATFWRRTAQNSGSGSTVTLNITAPSAQDHNTVAYEIVQPAGPSTTPVTATRATTWVTRATTAASRATTWTTSTTTTSTRGTTWDTKGVTASTRATTWVVRSAATGTRATTWTTRASLSSTRASTWTVRATLSASRATTWAVSASTTATRATTWVASAQVAATRASAWNVAGVLTSVSATRATSWTTRASIAASRGTTWPVLTVVGTVTRSTTWAAAAPVTSTRATTWTQRATATQTRSTTWHARALTSATRATEWTVSTPVAAQRATLWDVLARVGPSTRSTTFNAPATVVAFRSTSWGVGSTQTTHTIFTNQTPTATSNDDLQALRLATRFSSSTVGTVTGMRCYLGNTDNAGQTLTARLYGDDNSTLLASGTLTAPSTTGWVEIPFTTPYEVTTGTSYRATIHIPSPGTYSYITNGYASAITNGPLTANASSNGGNGWWAYSATPGPATNASSSAAAYMVDLTLSTAPALTSVTSSRPTTWQVIERITASRASTWTTSTTTQSTRATTWATTSAASATRATTWATRAPVAATRASTWTARALTTGTRATTWTVRVPLAAPATRATTWTVRTPVSATRATQWGVGSTIVSVTAARATSWSLVGRITSERSTLWEIRATMAPATRTTTWTALARLASAATRPSTWSVSARATSTRSTTFSVKAALTADRPTQWTVRAGVTPSSRASQWAVLSGRTSSRSTTWSLRHLVTRETSTQWAVHVTLAHVTVYGLAGPYTATASATGPTRASHSATGPQQALTVALGPTAPEPAATMVDRTLETVGPSLI